MSVDLGPVRILGAEAVGQPGQRRFRLFVQSISGSAIMWMEKEQLQSLSLALDRSLALVTEGQVLRIEARADGQPVPGRMPEEFPNVPTHELQVGRMQLSYDERDDTFQLSAVPVDALVEGEEELDLSLREEDAVSFIFTLQDAQDLSTAITSVVSAGRPLCPLCHTPLDGGPHACVKQNGHRKIVPVKEDEE